MKDKLKTVIIGDIHGCLEEFQELLELVDYKSPDVEIILAGDLIDRGPESAAVVALCRKLNLRCAQGNHDLKFIKWWKNAGSTNDVYDKHPHYNQLSDEDVNYIARMSPYIKIDDNTIAVHAGLKPGIPLEKQTKDDLCYIRYIDQQKKFVSLKKINNIGSIEQAGAHFWTEWGPFGYNIIYGHQVWEEPRIDKFDDGTACYGIDTGCCFGGSLSALIWETKEFVQVKAKQEYYKSTFKIR